MLLENASFLGRSVRLGAFMRLNEVHIQNYRGLEELVFQPQPNANLLIGDNGAGKTTVLGALRAVLSQWTAEPVNVFPRDHQRVVMRDFDGIPSLEPRYPAHLSVAGTGLDGQPFASVDQPTDGKSESSLAMIARPRFRRYIQEAEANPSLILPLLVSFSPWREPPRAKRPRQKGAGPRRRVDGYEAALDVHADIRGFSDWLRTFDQSSIVESRTFDHVEHARVAVIRCIPGCTDLRYLPRFDDVMVKWGSGDLDPLWRLSDGYRTMVAMVGEMAWRAAILNPSARFEPNQAPGIVLIDEIDLHLHPKWQHRVVSDLRDAFPAVQFFMTTHSPFVLQGMRREEVISLSPGERRDYFVEGIEDLSVEVMGAFSPSEVVPRSRIYREYERISRRYLELAQRETDQGTATAEMEAEFANIQEHLVSNPGLAAFLRMQRISRQGSR
jgi:hypothetical protein